MPSIIILGVLVLIIIVGAVFILVRAYRARQRRRIRMPSKAELDSGRRSVQVVSGSADGTPRNSQRGPGTLVRTTTVSSRSEHAPRTACPFSLDAAAVRGKNAYNPYPTISNIHVAEIALGVAPAVLHRHSSSLSKLERLTGQPLSNDLYEPARSPWSPRGCRETKGPSYPPMLPKQHAASVSTPSLASAQTSSPIHPLHPPPRAYPHINRLSENIGSAAPITQRLSTASATGHIASQYNPTLSRYPPRNTFGSFPARAEDSPPAIPVNPRDSFHTPHAQQPPAAVRDSTRPPIPPRSSSRDRTLGKSIDRVRRSWTGRSVLFLEDEAPMIPVQVVKPPGFGLGLQLDRPPSIQSIQSSDGSTMLSLPENLYQPLTPAPPVPASKETSRGRQSRTPTRMTEQELEAEMERIRERARRVSEERRNRAKEWEDVEGGESDGDAGLEGWEVQEEWVEEGSGSRGYAFI